MSVFWEVSTRVTFTIQLFSCCKRNSQDKKHFGVLFGYTFMPLQRAGRRLKLVVSSLKKKTFLPQPSASLAKVEIAGFTAALSIPDGEKLQAAMFSISALKAKLCFTIAFWSSIPRPSVSFPPTNPLFFSLCAFPRKRKTCSWRSKNGGAPSEI